MTDKITALERTVVEAAMEWMDRNYPTVLPIEIACRRLAEARAALEPVPGEAEAWMGLFPGSRGWDCQPESQKLTFRAALRIAIKADREARNG